MTLGLAALLGALALVDSTSFGTLLIPLWLLIAPGPVRVGRVLAYLGTVAGAYLLLGVALVSGVTALLGGTGSLLDSAPVARLQLVLGLALLVGSFFVGRRPTSGEGRAGRLTRWRARALGDEADGGRSGVGGLVTLALVAVLLEAATMLPYLGAAALISGADLTAGGRGGVVALYCAVMVAPALCLLGLRVVLRERIEPPLARLAGWMEAKSAGATGWAVGIVGFLVARDALPRVPEVAALLARLDAWSA